MQEFISIPTIKSGLYMFGGHQHTVSGGWSFFEQSHQVLELMVILDGSQITNIRHQLPLTLNAGDAVLIAPGTLHTNKNASKERPLTYMCLHFDFESVLLRSRIISSLTNRLIPAHSILAEKSRAALTRIVDLCRDKKQQSQFRVRAEIEIILLQYLQQLDAITGQITPGGGTQQLPFSDKEAKTARDIALAIQDRVNSRNNDPAFTFADICSSLHLSNGYGHRVFKKVYGVTPLRFINREKCQKAQRLLEYSGNSIEQVAYLVGAANRSIFSKQFKKWSGMTPTEYRKRVKYQRHVYSKDRTGYFE